MACMLHAGIRFNQHHFIYNYSHIEEHLLEKANIDLEDASNKELGFFFFTEHDYNNDNKLDGLELFKAVTHYMEPYTISTKKKRELGSPEKIAAHVKEATHNRNDDTAEELDKVLIKVDLNQDGYLTYPEYVAALKMTQ